MLGTTITRDGLREEEAYTYSPDRPVPSYDARYGREQNIYDKFASADVVNQRPMPRQAQPQPRMYSQTAEPMARGDELWQRLNTNNAQNSSSVANCRAFAPLQSNVEVFEPMKYSAPKTRQASQKKNSKAMSTQGKVIMAVYLAVVLLIVTLVIINAELINTPSTDVDAGTATVNNLYEVNDDGLNFIETQYNSAEVETNWFDKTLDKMGE